MKAMPKEESAEAVSTDPAASAQAAGLLHVSDAHPGLSRRRSGKGFVFLDEERRPIRDRAEVARIRSLGIPPAWTNVWICPSPRGHIQATGRDARQRKQYRYHPRWREVRDGTKFHRMIGFAAALAAIRQQTEEHLRLGGLPREKVLATLVQLLEATLIRVGNEEYARENGSFGLTTMRDGHARFEGPRLTFRFRGKSGKEHEIEVGDRRLARIVRRCQELPGDELFQYVDAEGVRQKVGSADVNEYLRGITGEDFTAKDFRTWFGTMLAASALGELDRADSEATAKRNVAQAIEAVAGRLGNTRTICRRCYVHPAVIDAYMDGELARSRREPGVRGVPAATDEAAVLALLKRRHAREQEPLASRPRRSVRAARPGCGVSPPRPGVARPRRQGGIGSHPSPGRASISA